MRRHDGAGEPRLKQEPPSHTNTFSITATFQLVIQTIVNTGPLRGKSQVNFGPRARRIAKSVTSALYVK